MPHDLEAMSPFIKKIFLEIRWNGDFMLSCLCLQMQSCLMHGLTMYEFAMDKRLTAMVPSEGMQSGMACPTSLGKATGGLISM